MMRRCQILWFACLLQTTGCYALLGSDHNHTVAKRLRPGMPLEECRSILATGGQIANEQDVPLASDESRSSFQRDEAAFAALQRIEQQSGVRVARVTNMHRHWGFMGFGDFWLYFDEGGHLLDFWLFHVN
jgi:hypothetical protein